MANHHVVVGTGGRRVICLHGWFGSATGWGPVVSCFDPKAFSYAFMDYRGYGGSKDAKGDYSMKEIAADTLALADQLGWKSFSLVGHSMGGMAIQRVLADAPGRIERLVAVNPVPASGVPFDDATWGFFQSAAENRDARCGIIDLTTGKRLTKKWIDDVVDYSLEHSTKEAFGAYLVSWAKTDFASEIEGNKTPIAVVVGEHDPALGADAMQGTFMKHYPNAALTVLANAGHYPNWETPVALATTIERFLAQ